MRRVRVEEATAVGAEVLDSDLRRGRTEREGLRSDGRFLGHLLARGVLHRIAVGVLDRLGRRGRLQQRHVLVSAEVLHDALRGEQQGDDERQRQQHVQRAARQIDPEIADALRGLAHEAADQRDQHGDAGRGRKKVLHRKSEHLSQITHRRLAAVALPVRVRGEADRGVHRRIGCDGAEALRIERQPLLHALQQIDDEQAKHIECEHRDRIALPAHVLVRADAGHAIDQTLDRRADAIDTVRLVREHGSHKGAERLDRQQQDNEIEADLQPCICGHSNHSGLSRATAR